MLSLEGADSIASLISSQTELLWSAAIALLVAEIYVGCRYFEAANKEVLKSGIGWLWIVSTLSFLVSLFFGYLVNGALVLMTKEAALGRNALGFFEDAETAALLQFGAFFLGLASLIIVFVSDFAGIAKALKSKE